MTDYDAVHDALLRAADAMNAEIEYLKSLRADQNIIDSLQGDIACIVRADDIVWQYQKLEN